MKPNNLFMLLLQGIKRHYCYCGGLLDTELVNLFYLAATFCGAILLSFILTPFVGSETAQQVCLILWVLNIFAAFFSPGWKNLLKPRSRTRLEG